MREEEREREEKGGNRSRQGLARQKGRRIRARQGREDQNVGIASADPRFPR